MSLYKTLDFSKFETRLLQLLPPPPADEADTSEIDIVRCNILQDISLLDPPEYHALSYCWGRDGGMESIIVDGIQVEVTANLESALRELRGRSQKCDLLWVDALCINQHDLYEKSYQISRMGQIYSSAALVIAWLGPAEHGIESKAHFSGEKVTDISVLSTNPFWSRVWIIQEISRASTVELRYGPISLSWKRLCTEAGLSTKLDRLRMSDKYKAKYTALQDMISPLNDFRTRERSDIFGGKRLSMLRALVDSRYSMATDLRDKVYALLGITIDGPTLVPMPNYISTVQDVFIQCARRIIINQQQVSAILLAARARYDNPDVASWIPNWAALGDQRIPPWILKSIQCSRPSDAINITWKPGNDYNVRFPIAKDARVESVLGFTSNNTKNLNCGLPNISDRKLVERLFEIFEVDNLRHRLRGITRMIDLGISAMDAAKHRSQIFDFTRTMLGSVVEGAPTSRCNIISEWWKADEATVLGVKTLGEISENVNRETKPKMRSVKQLGEKAWVPIRDKLQQFKRYSMSIALTDLDEPKFRCVYSATRVGDHMCAMPNCPLPVILRPLNIPRRRRDSYITRYQFVGEVFPEQEVTRPSCALNDPFPFSCFAWVDMQVTLREDVAKPEEQIQNHPYPWPSIWKVEDMNISKEQSRELC